MRSHRNTLRQTMTGAALIVALAAPAWAETFEVEEPEAERGEFELEILNAVNIAGVARGDERASHELSLGYGITSFWAASVGLEFGIEKGGEYEVEGYEIESTFVFLKRRDMALGLQAALEIPDEGGFDEAELAVGPLVAFEANDVEFVGNVFVEIPFEDGEDPGLTYAASVMFEGLFGDVEAGDLEIEDFKIGFEAHGEAEEAFGDGDEHALFIGPAISSKWELGEAEWTTRLGVFAGVDDAEADAAVSFNIEFEF